MYEWRFFKVIKILLMTAFIMIIVIFCRGLLWRWFWWLWRRWRRVKAVLTSFTWISRTLTKIFFFTIQNTRKIYALNIKGNPFLKNVMINLFVIISRTYEYCGMIIVRGGTLFVTFSGKFLPKNLQSFTSASIMFMFIKLISITLPTK